MGRKELIAAFARDRYRTVSLETRFMIEHVDGRHVRLPPAHSQLRMVARVLEKRMVLRYVDDGRATQITEAGRWALAEILANLAEILDLAEPKNIFVERLESEAILASGLPEDPFVDH